MLLHLAEFFLFLLPAFFGRFSILYEPLDFLGFWIEAFVLNLSALLVSHFDLALVTFEHFGDGLERWLDAVVKRLLILNQVLEARLALKATDLVWQSAGINGRSARRRMEIAIDRDISFGFLNGRMLLGWDQALDTLIA